MSDGSTLFLISPGPRPPYWKVAEHLWGQGADVDSDGNSQHPDDSAWTELTVELRTARHNPDDTEDPDRVDIDPVSEDPLVLKLVASSPELASRAARYLSQYCAAAIASQWLAAGSR